MDFLDAPPPYLGFAIKANPLQGDTYQGIWQRYTEPGYRRWLLTLTNLNALLLMACLGVLLSFALPRNWVTLRYLVFRCKPRIGLRDATDDLPTLSQLEALGDILSYFQSACRRTWLAVSRPFRRESMHGNTDFSDPPNSLWYGAMAVLNFTAFTIMAAMLPSLLTEGAFSAPVVRSKITNECLLGGSWGKLTKYILQLPRTDAIYQQCGDGLHGNCASQYYLQNPQIQKKRIEACPFFGGICYKDVRPLEITHYNMAPVEMGINSRSKVTLDHRLTCAPVDVSRFQVQWTDSAHSTTNYICVQEPIERSAPHIGYCIRLNTINGPNLFSNESSGGRMAEEGGPYSLTVLPAYELTAISSRAIPNLSELLRRDDGMSFLIIYRAGSTSYAAWEVDDPFFAAHNLVAVKTDKLVEAYYADREATALGCFEQFRYCLANSVDCSPWAYMSEGLPIISGNPALADDLPSQAELMASFGILPAWLSVFDRLTMLTEWHSNVPISKPSWKIGTRQMLESYREQWLLEVEKWFMKSYLSAILATQSQVEFGGSVFTENGYPTEFTKEYSLCGRILFRDNNYTNINWIGFCATTGALAFICLSSFTAHPIYKIVKRFRAGSTPRVPVFPTLCRWAWLSVRQARSGLAEMRVSPWLKFTASWRMPDFRGYSTPHRAWWTHQRPAPPNLELEYDHSKSAAVLLRYGANINTQCNDGWTPLLRAINSNSHRVLQLLLDSGADYLINSFKDETVLHFAARRGDLETMRLLDLKQLDIEAKTTKGHTAKELMEFRQENLSELVTAFENLLKKLDEGKCTIKETASNFSSINLQD